MTAGFIHRIRVGGVSSLAIVLAHLARQRITKLSVMYDADMGDWHVEFHHAMKDVNWALDALRPDILPPRDRATPTEEA